MKELLFGAVALVIALGVGYGMWLVKKNINYSFEYESMVIETVEAKYEKRITDLETQIKLLQEAK